MNEYYAEPDHEPEEQTEDHQVDEHMDSGIRTKPRRDEEDEDDELGVPA